MLADGIRPAGADPGPGAVLPPDDRAGRADPARLARRRHAASSRPWTSRQGPVHADHRDRRRGVGRRRATRSPTNSASPCDGVVIGPGPRGHGPVRRLGAAARGGGERGAAGPAGQTHRLAHDVVAAGPRGRVTHRTHEYPGAEMTGLRFDHQTLPQRVRFASSAAAENLRDALTELGAHRFMVIAWRGQRAARGRDPRRGCRSRVRHGEVVMHVPVAVAQRARDAAAELRR